MKNTLLTKENLPRLCMITVTAILITATGIIYKQSFMRILPLYISLFVGMLQSKANRYAHLLGGLNSLLYMLVYIYLGLYASAGYCLLFSFPVQIAAFVLWGRRQYGKSTMFRKMSVKARILVSVIFVLAFIAVLAVLSAANSSFKVLDTLSSLLGSLISVLTMLAFIEYTWLMLPSGVISIALHIATMTAHPEQITYLVYSLYSMICIILQFFRVRRLYGEQNGTKAVQ